MKEDSWEGLIKWMTFIVGVICILVLIRRYTSLEYVTHQTVMLLMIIAILQGMAYITLMTKN